MAVLHCTLSLKDGHQVSRRHHIEDRLGTLPTGELAAAILEVEVMPLTELLKFGLDLVVVHFQR